MRREHWHLTEALIFAHFAFFFMTSTTPGTQAMLELLPGQVAARPWSVVTFQFLHGGIIWFFFSMLILWIMARPLEEEWGSPRFLIFWLVSVLGAAGTAIAFGQPLAGDIFLDTSLLFTFATLSPDTEFLLFFILPVKVKWLALIGGGLLLFSSFVRLGPLGGAANAVGMSAGYIFFLATRKLPSRRKIAFQMKKARGAAVAAAKDTVVERRNLEWNPRVRAAISHLEGGEAPTGEDEALFKELKEGRDPSITVCAPEDFGMTDDPVCRKCSGYAECALRKIRSTEKGN